MPFLHQSPKDLVSTEASFTSNVYISGVNIFGFGFLHYYGLGARTGEGS